MRLAAWRVGGNPGLLAAAVMPLLACVHWADPGPDPEESAVAHAWSRAGLASEVGWRAQCELVESLDRLGFAESARHVRLEISRAGPGHPCFAEAADALLAEAADPAVGVLVSEVVQRLGAGPFARVSPERYYRVNLLLGESAVRAGHWSEARRILGDDWSIPPGSLSYARAQYLLGVMASAGGWPAPAAEVPVFFARAREYADDDGRLGELAVLRLARARRGLGQEREALALYQQIPPASPWWAQARLELAWARLLEGDALGAFGAIAALRALPPLAHFLPEAPLLEAAIFAHRGFPSEAQSSLERFQAVWRPLLPALRQLIEQAGQAGGGPALLADRPLPPALGWLLDGDPVLVSLARAIQASLQEQSRITSVVGFQGTVAGGVANLLAADRERLAWEAGRRVQLRLADAARRLRRLIPAAEALQRSLGARPGGPPPPFDDSAQGPGAASAAGRWPERARWAPAPGNLAQVLQVIAEGFSGMPEEL